MLDHTENRNRVFVKKPKNMKFFRIKKKNYYKQIMIYLKHKK